MHARQPVQEYSDTTLGGSHSSCRIANLLSIYCAAIRYALGILPRSAPSGNISNACFSGLDDGRLVDPIRYDHRPERKVLQCTLHLPYYTYEKDFVTNNCISDIQDEYHCHPSVHPQHRTITSPSSTNTFQDPCNSPWPSILGLSTQIYCCCRDDR